MSSFDNREAASETRFVLDAQQEFKAQARRNKRLGHWAAELLGKDAEKYAMEVIASDMEEAGDEDVFRKLRRDFDASTVDMADEIIRAKMNELLDAVRAEIAEE